MRQYAYSYQQHFKQHPVSSSTKIRVDSTSRKSPAHTGCYAKYRFVSVTYFSANMIILPAACKILLYIYIYTEEQRAQWRGQGLFTNFMSEMNSRNKRDFER